MKNSSEFRLELVDAKQTLSARGNKPNVNSLDGTESNSSQCKSTFIEGEFCLLRISLHRSTAASFESAAAPESAGNRLELECENGELATHLVQSLVIDRLRLDPISCSSSLSLVQKLAGALSSSSSLSADNLVACCRLQLQQRQQEDQTTATVSLRPLLEELVEAHKQLSEQEESESRILTELYESADYVKNLIQQLSIAIELNEL